MKKVRCEGCEYKGEFTTIIPFIRSYQIKDKTRYVTCKLKPTSAPLRAGRLRYCRSFKPTFVYLIKEKSFGR